MVHREMNQRKSEGLPYDRLGKSQMTCSTAAHEGIFCYPDSTVVRYQRGEDGKQHTTPHYGTLRYGITNTHAVGFHSTRTRHTTGTVCQRFGGGPEVSSSEDRPDIVSKVQGGDLFIFATNTPAREKTLGRRLLSG